MAHSMASSLELTLMIQYPAMSSLVSVKGPSMTLRLPPENLMRAPLELGWSPAPSTRTPAFTSSSLYLPIAEISSSLGITPASESLLAFTIIMNFIVNFSSRQYVEGGLVKSTVSESFPETLVLTPALWPPSLHRRAPLEPARRSGRCRHRGPASQRR